MYLKMVCNNILIKILQFIILEYKFLNTKLLCTMKNLFNFLLALILFSCELDNDKQPLMIEEPESLLNENLGDNKDLHRFLKDYGFNLSDVQDYPGFYLIERCISVDKNLLKSGSYKKKGAENAHARTTALVNSSPWNIKTIRIKIDSSIPISGDENWRSEISQAIADLNSINNFRLHFEIVTSESFDILIRSDLNTLDPGVVAVAEWPAAGNPGYQIRINLDVLWNNSSLPSAARRRNIVHEIGHCIGYRHTNHPVANSGGPEGIGPGLHEIPGTWSNDIGSVMNGNTGEQSWIGFSVLDILSIRAVYPIDPGESPLFTYIKDFSSTIKSHNWTGEWSEFGLASTNGYNYRGYTGFIYLYPKANTVQLYRYVHSSNTYYLTTDPNLSSTYPSFTLDKSIGYVYVSAGLNRIPVYEYYNNDQGHFFTTNYGDAWTNGSGWLGGGIAFYVEKIL